MKNNCFNLDGYYLFSSLDSLDPAEWKAVPPMNSCNSSKENTMYSQIDNERNYLKKRTQEILYIKRRDLEKETNLNYFPFPKTGKELKEWVAAGRLVVSDRLRDDKHFDDDYDDNPLYFLEFTDPNRVRDPVKYETLMTKIYKDQQEVEDVIAIDDPKVALTAVKEFEARTYH